MTKIGNNYNSYLNDLIREQIIIIISMLFQLSHGDGVIVLQYESQAYPMSHLLSHKDVQVN